VLTITGSVRLWEIGVLAVVLGLNNAFENPARQSFVLEMVGADTLRNAVSLNSVQVNVARAVGPGRRRRADRDRRHRRVLPDQRRQLRRRRRFAGLDGALRRSIPTPPAPRAPGQLREGLRYARATPEIIVPLLMMALVGTLAYEFQVSLPVMARHALHAGAEGYGFMTAAMGVGAIIGGLVVAARGRTGLRPVTVAVAAFAVALALAALAPTLAVELIALALVGAASVSFMSSGNSTLQLAPTPSCAAA
jgi:hypothetical protein